jgi:hypothetical protein
LLTYSLVMAWTNWPQAQKVADRARNHRQGRPDCRPPVQIGGFIQRGRLSGKVALGHHSLHSGFCGILVAILWRDATCLEPEIRREQAGPQGDYRKCHGRALHAFPRASATIAARTASSGVLIAPSCRTA